MATSHNLQALGPQLWGQASLLQTGHDASASTIFPSRSNTNTAHFIQHNQASPSADSSVNLASFFFTGVKWHTYLHVRSVSGATITAEWYKGGVATGISATFSNTIHKVIDLGEVQYSVGDLFAAKTMTLRLSGGDATAAELLMVGRQIGYDASTIVDTADGATTATDPQGLYGTVAKFPFTGQSATLKKFLTVTFADAHQQVSWAPIAALDPGNDTFHPAGMTSDYTSYLWSTFQFRTLINGTIPGQSSGHASQGWTPWTSWWDSVNVQPIETVFTTFNLAIEEPSVNTFPVSAGDVFDLRVDPTTTGLTSSWYITKWLFGRHLDDPSFTAVPGSSGPYNCGDTFSLSFTHPQPTWVDHFEGVVWDSAGDMVYDVGPITSPWTVPVNVFTTGSYTAAIQAVYSDGSYGFKKFDFTANACPSPGQIIRYR